MLNLRQKHFMVKMSMFKTQPALVAVLGILIFTSVSVHAEPKMEVVTFKNGKLSLQGELYKPSGDGPFPVMFYNHGSAPGMLNSQAAGLIAPMYEAKGWAFFMPYRRGQGLSEKAGAYVSDEIDAAGAETMVSLLKGEQFSDQMAALAWLKEQKWVQKNRIAVSGNSFGGIETVLAVAKENYCGAVDASGGAESWSKSPDLQKLMKNSVKNAHAPIFFFQAENDFDLSPSRVLSEEMKTAGKKAEIKIYPAFGKLAREGHSFAYRGVKDWFPDVFNFLQKNCE